MCVRCKFATQGGRGQNSARFDRRVPLRKFAHLIEASSMLDIRTCSSTIKGGSNKRRSRWSRGASDAGSCSIKRGSIRCSARRNVDCGIGSIRTARRGSCLTSSRRGKMDRLRERLLSRVVEAEGPLASPCWIWTGASLCKRLRQYVARDGEATDIDPSSELPRALWFDPRRDVGLPRL